LFNVGIQASIQVFNEHIRRSYGL